MWTPYWRLTRYIHGGCGYWRGVPWRNLTGTQESGHCPHWMHRRWMSLSSPIVVGLDVSRLVGYRTKL